MFLFRGSGKKKKKDRNDGASSHMWTDVHLPVPLWQKCLFYFMWLLWSKICIWAIVSFLFLQKVKKSKQKGPAGIVGVPDDLWGRHLYTNCAKLKITQANMYVICNTHRLFCPFVHIGKTKNSLMWCIFLKDLFVFSIYYAHEICMNLGNPPFLLLFSVLRLRRSSSLPL